MILAIESSCDDSAIAVARIDTKKIIFHKRLSQAQHNSYGGVVPELASRLHTLNLPQILEEVKDFLPSVRAVAVTNGPGLSVSLLEGVMMAKALSISLDIPIIEIDHIKGHIFSVFIEKEAILPISALVVSGGHTMIVEANNYFDMKVIGKSLDDSIGESFDKVAKMLSLSYPGGPVIEELAKKGDENRFSWTIPLKQKKEIAFSYSGIKNSVRLEIQKLKNPNQQDIYDIAASFQKIAFEHILDKLKRYFLISKPKEFAIVGGVSANEYFRKKIVELCNNLDINIHFAKLEFCTDNAAMIARAALEVYKQQIFTPVSKLDVYTYHNLKVFLKYFKIVMKTENG